MKKFPPTLKNATKKMYLHIYNVCKNVSKNDLDRISQNKRPLSGKLPDKAQTESSGLYGSSGEQYRVEQVNKTGASSPSCHEGSSSALVHDTGTIPVNAFGTKSKAAVNKLRARTKELC